LQNKIQRPKPKTTNLKETKAYKVQKTFCKSKLNVLKELYKNFLPKKQKFKKKDLDNRKSMLKREKNVVANEE
jgi:hypothetical protein